jgi:Protein of unknown function (DUF2651)
MIGTVFLLLYVLLPLVVIALSVLGTLMIKNAFTTPTLILVLFLILQLTNLFEVGYSVIFIYSLVSFVTTRLIITLSKKRKETKQTKTF